MYQAKREGGWDVTKLSYPKTDTSFHKFMTNELLRDVKESGCNIIWDTSKPIIPASYVLPDGRKLDYTSEASAVAGKRFFASYPSQQ